MPLMPPDLQPKKKIQKKNAPNGVNFSDLAHFTAKQNEALTATKRFRFVFYGGSMGAGKSYFLRWACLYWLLKIWAHKKQLGTRVALFCEDYPALADRQISRVKTEFPSYFGDYHEQSHEFRLKPCFGSGVLCFRNLDDPSKYQSSEFAMIAVDELPKNSFNTFAMLRTRLRWPGIREPKFLGAGNPGGEAWVKQYFVDRAFPPNEQEKGDFCYVRALPTDNPHLPPEYFKSLESLPEIERRAYLEGDWGAFDDAVDGDGFMRLVSDQEIANAYVSLPVHLGELVMGIDPAGGGDNSSVVVASETCAEIMFDQKLRDTMQLASHALAIAKERNVRHVCVDVTGIGQGVMDRLKEISRGEKHISFHPVVFGARAERPERYQNRKSEIYWAVREWILKGGKLKRADGWGDMASVKWRSSDKVVEIQSKAQLRSHNMPSPNVFDALAIAKSFRPGSPRTASIFKKPAKRNFSLGIAY